MLLPMYLIRTDLNNRYWLLSQIQHPTTTGSWLKASTDLRCFLGTNYEMQAAYAGSPKVELIKQVENDVNLLLDIHQF